VKTADVAVVGGGTSGLILAITAAERGLDVVLIEKAPLLGGTLDRSYASTSAAGTHFQAEHGIVDSPKKHFREVMEIGRGEADPVVTRLWIDHAAETVAWLESIGVTFRFPTTIYTGPGAHDPYSVARVQHVVGRGPALASALIGRLQHHVDAGRVSLRLSTAVTGLMRDGVGVSGVVVQDADGAPSRIEARSVVLSTGGCMANARLFEDLHGAALAYDAGYPFCTGDGLLLGQLAGGVLHGGDAFNPLIGLIMDGPVQPGVPAGGDFLQSSLNSAALDRPPWEIWVNARGERFVAEDAEHPQVKERALVGQPGQRLWVIHDQAMLEAYGSPIAGWDKARYRAAFDTLEMFHRAPTLAALGLLAGLDPAALAASVSAYNRALRDGAPDPHGRRHRPAPIGAGPYFAVCIQGYTLASFAGLKVDGSLRVTDGQGSPIPELYAVGEILGATAIGSSGYATGSQIMPALALGRHLGGNVLPSAIGKR